eukprot:4665853-Alexandrium_andersonii.AAC.1
MSTGCAPVPVPAQAIANGDGKLALRITSWRKIHPSRLAGALHGEANAALRESRHAGETSLSKPMKSARLATHPVQLVWQVMRSGWAEC